MAKAKKQTLNEPRRAGIVMADQISPWTSCQSITRNLSKSYEGFLGTGNFDVFKIKTDSSNAWSLAETIYEHNPTHLIFVDHKPHPMALLESLASVYGNRRLPQLTFHLFGCFTLFPKEWVKVEPLLFQTPTKFICSSPRQAKLVSTFLDETTAQPDVCHFPTDTSVFNYDSELRKKVRAKLKVKDDEIVITYTGRLSLQKNIFRLVRDLSSLWMRSQVPFRIFFAGPYDDLGAPFFGLNFSAGAYFNQISSILKRLPLDISERFKYLGNLEAEELRGLYNAADIFTSLSLHHDEDYGMSPAEALCCGLPSVLTDWGGYASFKRDEKSCYLVPVRLGSQGPEIATDHLTRGILEHMARKETSADRKSRSDFYCEKLSIEAGVQRLKEIHKKPAEKFNGFSNLMETYARNYKYNNLYNQGSEQQLLYKEIYGNYTNKSTEADF
jgi:glycosyltransferase involved in cell wall biosynthesis